MLNPATRDLEKMQIKEGCLGYNLEARSMAAKMSYHIQRDDTHQISEKNSYEGVSLDPYRNSHWRWGRSC